MSTDSSPSSQRILWKLDSLKSQNPDGLYLLVRGMPESERFLSRNKLKDRGTFSIDDPKVLDGVRSVLSYWPMVAVVIDDKAQQIKVYSVMGESGGCFIATAAFGSSLVPEVLVLRRFRDEILLESKLGTAVVELYYLVSPPLAQMVSRVSFLRTAVRRLLLTPIVRILRDRG